MKRNQKWNELQDNTEKMERALKKLTRLVAHIDRLRIERNRMVKRQQPPKDKPLKVTGEEYTKIRDQDFGDTADDLFQDKCYCNAEPEPHAPHRAQPRYLSVR